MLEAGVLTVAACVEAARGFGASDAGVFRCNDGPEGLPFGLSLVVRLSDAIIDEIADEPTYTYFNHYRSVNACIDQLLLRAGLFLQQRGARYITVAASQSRPDSSLAGRYSHKKAAVSAGLGTIGRNHLFLHRQWGARVRLGTLFTDYPFEHSDFPVGGLAGELADSDGPAFDPRCASCGACVASCPALAFGSSAAGAEFSRQACSDWMKKKYQHIGRGVVCGICVRVCPLAGATVD